MNWRETVSPFLHVLYGSTVRPYSTYDFGRAQDESCVSVIAAASEARKKLPVLRERLSPGLVAFIGTNQWLGDEKHDGSEVVVGKCESQFDILQIARTVNIEAVTRHLQRYDDNYGIDIFAATSRSLSFMLMSAPDDLPSFVKTLHQICPNISDSTGENIGMTSEVHLWWN